jgi:hypothetical protein
LGNKKPSGDMRGGRVEPINAIGCLDHSLHAAALAQHWLGGGRFLIVITALHASHPTGGLIQARGNDGELRRRQGVRAKPIRTILVSMAGMARTHSRDMRGNH